MIIVLQKNFIEPYSITNHIVQIVSSIRIWHLLQSCGLHFTTISCYIVNYSNSISHPNLPYYPQAVPTTVGPAARPRSVTLGPVWHGTPSRRPARLVQPAPSTASPATNSDKTQCSGESGEMFAVQCIMGFHYEYVYILCVYEWI